MLDPDEDPALAWALVERFAGAVVPRGQAEVRAALASLSAAVPADGALPDDAALVKLTALYGQLGAHVANLASGCANVRRMMAEHYRCFPAWHREKASEGIGER